MLGFGKTAALTWAAAALVSATACTTLLGNEFTIVEGSGGGNAGGGGNATGGSGGMGGSGGGGGQPAPPLSCAWTSLRELASLEGMGSPGNVYESEIRMEPTDHGVLLFVHRFDLQSGNVVEIFAADESSESTMLTTGYDALDVHRVSGTKVGAIVGRQDPSTGDHAVDYLRIDDDDDQLANVTTTTLVNALPTTGGLQGRFVPIPSSQDIAMVLTRRPTTNDPFQASFGRVDPSAPDNLVVFDDSSTDSELTGGDYRPAAMVRDESGQNHVVLGEAFEQSAYRRHFVLDDGVDGTVPPETKTSLESMPPALVGIHPRADGDFLAAYGVFTTNSTELRLGPLTAEELPAHDPTALTLAGEVAGPLGETGFELTDASVALLSTTDDPHDFRLIIAHASGTFRHDGVLAIPDTTWSAGDGTVARVAATTRGSTLDTAFGGTLFVSFYVDGLGTDGHSRLYLGEIECQGP